MKIQLSKSETQFLKVCLQTREAQNLKNLKIATDNEDENLDKHINHFERDDKLLESIHQKLKGDKCQLDRCCSELTASVRVSNYERKWIYICETCAMILEAKEGDELPEHLNRLDLYYQDSTNWKNSLTSFSIREAQNL